jgi:hypothetical protein
VIEERAPKNVATNRHTRFSDWSLPDDPSEHGNGRWKASTPIEILLWVGFENRAQPGLAGMMCFYSMLVLPGF